MGDRVIVPEEIKAMANSLTVADNKISFKLLLTKAYLQKVIDNEEDFKGKTAEGMRDQLTDHIAVIDATRRVLDQNKEDLRALINGVGFETLNEPLLEEAKAGLEEHNAQLEAAISALQGLLSTADSIAAAGIAAAIAIDNWLISLNNNAIEKIKTKLQRIEDIDAATQTLFSLTDLNVIQNAITDLCKAYSSGDFKPIQSAYISQLPRLAVDNDPQGERLGVSEDFIQITDEDGNVYYGGDQGWFSEYDINVKGQGCGIMATINMYLYLTGQTNVTKEYYMSLVDEYLEMFPLIEYQLDHNIGALPTDMSAYLEEKCREAGISLEAGWNGTEHFWNGPEDQYSYIEQKLKAGQPVVWALYDFGGDGVNFYTFDGTEYKSTQSVNSHYITITAVYESENEDGSTRRMLEISSWGKKYYVDYDEYIDVIDDNIADRLFSSTLDVELTE